MPIADSTLPKLVEFVNGGQTILTVYRPDSKEHEPFTPIAHARAEDGTLVWEFGGSEFPAAEKVLRVDQDTDQGTMRVVLDARYPTELRVHRASAPHHKKMVEEFKASRPEPHPDAGAKLDSAKTREAWPTRDKDYYFSRWFEGEELVGVAVVGDEGIRFSPTFDARPEPMEYVREHYGPYDWFTKAEGMRLLSDLFENPIQSRVVSAPEYVKASDLEDAVSLARNKAVGDYINRG